MMTVAEKLALHRKYRSNDRAFRIKKIIQDLELHISDGILREIPRSAKWIGERMLLRQRLIDLYYSQPDHDYIWPEDCCL